MTMITGRVTTDRLLTAEEYLLLPDTGRPTELVRGRIVSTDWPTPWHGYVCCNVAGVLGDFVEEVKGGRLTNGSGVVTERDPDTVRGADVAFYSYERVPRARSRAATCR